MPIPLFGAQLSLKPGAKLSTWFSPAKPLVLPHRYTVLLQTFNMARATRNSARNPSTQPEALVRELLDPNLPIERFEEVLSNHRYVQVIERIGQDDRTRLINRFQQVSLLDLYSCFHPFISLRGSRCMQLLAPKTRIS